MGRSVIAYVSCLLSVLPWGEPMSDHWFRHRRAEGTAANRIWRKLFTCRWQTVRATLRACAFAAGCGQLKHCAGMRSEKGNAPWQMRLNSYAGDFDGCGPVLPRQTDGQHLETDVEQL
jgi:hypothetical protein